MGGQDLTEIFKALSYFKTALKLKSELSQDLLEHLQLFDSTVRFALGLIEMNEYKDKLKALGSASHIRYYIEIDAIKEEYLSGVERDIEKQYAKFVEQMNAILEAEDANENIKLLVRCEMVLYEGSKINLALVRDLNKINAFEFLIGASRKRRQDIARNFIQRKMAWAEKARGIRDEVIKAKNYFVFYHVLLNETKVDYEFEAYTDLINNGTNSVNIRADERKENLNSLLKNLNQTIQYFQHITYVENICVALSIKYEILHYMNDMEAANTVLRELSDIIETHDLRELHRKFEALKNHGTTHEKILKFKEQQAAESLERQREQQNIVKEMEKMDNLDTQRNIAIENPDTIELYPIHHFQFCKTDRKKVYEILNVSEEAQVVFDRMLDVDKDIPIANIYHNPILQEGNADGMVFNNSIEAWRNIFRIRKAFFDNGFLRIVLKFPGIETDSFT